MMRRIATAITLLLGVAAHAVAGPAQAAPTAETLAQVRQLVDDHYGNPVGLNKAAALLAPVLSGEHPPSDAFVQAARITLKGGYIAQDRFMPNTQKLAASFIERALALEPGNVRALSLQAQSLLGEGDLEGARAVIRKGLSLQPSYPWLHLAMARYDEETRDLRGAVSEYAVVIQGGCSNSDPDQRRAFTTALVRVSHLMNKQDALTRRYAQDADRCRHPDDAWTLSNFAQVFNESALFDDGIAYARKALLVMSHGAARKDLAMALYGKAAQLSMAGQDPTPALAEANAMRFPPEQAIGWFARSKAEAHAYLPAVAGLLRTRN